MRPAFIQCHVLLFVGNRDRRHHLLELQDDQLEVRLGFGSNFKPDQRRECAHVVAERQDDGPVDNGLLPWARRLYVRTYEEVARGLVTGGTAKDTQTGDVVKFDYCKSASERISLAPGTKAKF